MSALTTFARPLSIAPASYAPAGTVEVPCSQCQALLSVPAAQAHEPVTCRGCLHDLAQVEAQRLQSDVAALRAGEAPFDALTREERQEQLDALYGPGVVAALASPVVVYDEPIYDSGGYEPDAQTRDEIESREEHPMAGMFEDDFGL